MVASFPGPLAMDILSGCIVSRAFGNGYTKWYVAWFLGIFQTYLLSLCACLMASSMPVVWGEGRGGEGRGGEGRGGEGRGGEGRGGRWREG